MTSEEQKNVPVASPALNYDREVLLDLIILMRDQQKKYFEGDRSYATLREAQKREINVDKFVQKALSDAGWKETDWRARPQPVRQTGLF